MALLLYVDDIVLIDKTMLLLHSFTRRLGTEIKIKDLGTLHYFLDLEVTPLSQEVTFVSKQIYP